MSEEKLQEDSLPGLTSVGGFNDMPEPYTLTDIHELLHNRIVLTDGNREHRQIIWKDDRGRRQVQAAIILHIRNHIGFMVLLPQKWNLVSKEEKEKGAHFLQYDLSETKVYRLGCIHEMTELSREEARKQGIYHAGRCWHVLKCNKCGHVQSYDSSD